MLETRWMRLNLNSHVHLWTHSRSYTDAQSVLFCVLYVDLHSNAHHTAVVQHSPACGHKNRPHSHCGVPPVLWCQNQLQGQGRQQPNSQWFTSIIYFCHRFNPFSVLSGRGHSSARCSASQQIQDSEAAHGRGGRHKNKKSRESLQPVAQAVFWLKDYFKAPLCNFFFKP